MNRRKIWIAGAVAFAIVCALVAWRGLGEGVFYGRRGSAESGSGAMGPVGVPVPRLQVDPHSIVDPLPQFNDVANAPPWGPEQLAGTMKDWRAAILNKNAEAVERIDDLFAASPDVFRKELETSAQKDADPRVRAFSTRVLGNAKRAEAIPTLRLCLKDTSEYVRANAAWALGQLKDVQSVALLSRLASKDASPAVRKAAADAAHLVADGKAPTRRP